MIETHAIGPCPCCQRCFADWTFEGTRSGVERGHRVQLRVYRCGNPDCRAFVTIDYQFAERSDHIVAGMPQRLRDDVDLQPSSPSAQTARSR